MISVIVPSYNSAATIGRTLDSLLNQSQPSLLQEIIVVDSSDDGRTPGILAAARGDRVRVIQLAKKTIPATARNLGAKEAKGDLLAFIDSDAYAETDWLERIEQLSRDGHAVGGGAILLPPEQRSRPLAVAQYFLQFSEFMGGPGGHVRFAPSCNLFCSRSLFEALGGFPEVRAGEDVLFGLRAQSRGTFRFEPSLRVRHIFTETWKRFRTNQALLGEYTLHCRRLDRTNWMYRGALPLLFLPVYAAVKLFRIASRAMRSPDGGLKARFILDLPWVVLGIGFLSWGFAAACFKDSPQGMSA